MSESKKYQPASVSGQVGYIPDPNPEAIIRQLEESRRALRESEERYRALAEQVADGIFVTNNEGRYVDANQAACNMLGYSRDEFLQLSVKDLLPPEELSRLPQQWAALSSGQFVQSDWVFQRKDGSRFVGELIAKGFGETRFQGVVRDVTERRRAEAALRSSQQTFRSFVTATSDAVYRMSPDWTDMRQVDGRALIADVDSPTKDWLQKYIHPEDRDYVMTAIQEAIRNKALLEVQHRVIRADGSLGWTSSRAVPVLDDKAEILEWLGTARDITRHKQDEEELALVRMLSEQSRRLYEAILSTTPDLVFVFDLNHRFCYANKALLEMWGKTWDEAIGKNCLELGYEPWQAEMHDREIDQVIATRQPIRADVPFTGTLGRRIYDYIFVPVIGINGEVEAVAGTTRDITERKQTEDELRRANQSLEQFAYSASHDLQEPLRTIIIYSQLLVSRYRERLDGSGLKYLDFVRSGAQRIDALLHDLLAYAQIGRGDSPPELTDADSVLTETLQNLEATITASGARVASNKLPVVPVHSVHLTQLLQNLIGNAIKYRSSARPPEIHVAAERQNPAGNWTFSVSDNGIGIAPEYRESIFGLFKRLYSVNQYDGTGIGLAICQRIVDQYHGRIWVESVEGEGSTFYFTLPA